MKQSGSHNTNASRWLAILLMGLAGSFLRAEPAVTNAAPAYDVVLSDTVYGSPVRIGLSQTGTIPSGKARPSLRWILRHADGKTLDSGVFQYG